MTHATRRVPRARTARSRIACDMLAQVSCPAADLIVPREIVRATGRLAGSQVFVSATLPLNATVGAVAAKELSGHEGLAGTSVGIAFLFSMLSLYVVGSIAAEPRPQAGAAGRAEPARRRRVLICGLAIWAESFALLHRRARRSSAAARARRLLGRAAAADLYPPMLRGRGVGTVATAGAIGAVVGPLIAIAAGPAAATLLGIARAARAVPGRPRARARLRSG